MADIDIKFHNQLETDCRYSGYLARQQADIEAMRRDDALKIPPETSFASIGGLSAESCDLLQRYQPETIGQASRIPGMTPAALVAVLRYIKKEHAYIISDEACMRDWPAERIVTLNRIFSPESTQKDVCAYLNVSRETEAKLEIYVKLLEKWQKRINMVSSKTLPFIWQRHILIVRS